MKLNLKNSIISLVLFLLVQHISFCEVTLPRLISDGMILQRNTPVKVWGWADPGEKIKVFFNKKVYEASANLEGEWQIILPAHKAGGSYVMKISASNEITINDILFGEVWLCSGQSNMEYPMSRLKERYAEEIANCHYSQIRQFKIPLIYNFNGPQDDFMRGSWKEANPENLPNFSGVAYFFAKELYLKYNVPVGILNASLGGSPIESWMSVEALKGFPKYIDEANKYADDNFIKELVQKEQDAINNWYVELNMKDLGLQSSPNWKDPSLDDSEWSTMPVPGYWVNHGLGMVNGVVWFRRSFDVPESMIGKPVDLYMGRMVDADSVFVNGTFVGTTSYQYPQRKYTIPEGVLKKGKNKIVVRLISNVGRGGFVEDKPYKLVAGEDVINLEGEWRLKLGCTMTPTPGQTFIRWKPTGLYNAMIAPSNNYVIKGTVWYQGESNIGRHEEYQVLLTSMINDWRKNREQADMPFIIAQLPNYLRTVEQPSNSDWAAFRNVQLKISQTVANTGISVNIDLGDWNDIHPQNKLDVGKRLALTAGKLAYGEKNIVSSGPVYQSMKKVENKIELSFRDIGNGLKINDGGELMEFAIAGEDNKFVWAKAIIKDDKVLVWNDNISDPVAVRYAWADNPDKANLYNKEGLPATPFTTEK